MQASSCSRAGWQKLACRRLRACVQRGDCLRVASLVLARRLVGNLPVRSSPLSSWEGRRRLCVPLACAALRTSAPFGGLGGWVRDIGLIVLGY